MARKIGWRLWLRLQLRLRHPLQTNIFVVQQLDNENLHSLNIKASTWLQHPTLPATQEQHALLTSPDKMHMPICNTSEVYSVTALALNKKYLWSLAHWISSRYSSSRNRFAFIKAVRTVWCSLLAMDFPDFIRRRSISSLVNSEILQPSRDLRDCLESSGTFLHISISIVSQWVSSSFKPLMYVAVNSFMLSCYFI